MRVNSTTRFAALAALVGALACAGNTAREADTDESAAARDTTTSDTTGQNPAGYRGMERDTTIAPTDSQPSDSFLQNQGTGAAQDTAGYSGMERDTTSMQGQTDTTSMQNQTDTTGGAMGADTSGTNQSTQLDSTGQSSTGDTTGYGNSQNQSDTTTSR